jgi:hypothetical protein
MKRRHVLPLFAFAAAAAALLLPSVAHAQAAPPDLTQLSAPLAVIAILGMVSAFVSQAENSGKFFGLFTIPQSAQPYLTFGGTFVVTFIAKVQAAGNLTNLTLFNAFQAAMFMLIFPAAGAAARSHFSDKKEHSDDAKAEVAKAAAAAAKVGVALALLIGLGATQTACGTPLAQTIEKTILVDIENGQALSFVEAAVIALDPALANDMTAVDSLIQAAVVVLETTGVIPVEAKANALALKTALGAKLTAAQKGCWVMPPATQREVAAILAGQRPRFVAAVARGARL